GFGRPGVQAYAKMGVLGVSALRSLLTTAPMTSRPKLRLVAPASTPSPGRAIPARDADDELVAHEPSGITPAGPRSAPMSRATLGALGELEDDHLVALAIQGEM